MRVQRSRADVLPLTWEVPVTILACWLVGLVLTLPLGQGVALWLTGRGFLWPQGTLVEAVVGLLQGDVGRGLPVEGNATLPSEALVYGTVALCEVIVCSIAAWAVVMWWRSIGPGAHVDVAPRSHVERVLGPSNLRQRRTTIRPDKYTGTRRLARR